MAAVVQGLFGSDQWLQCGGNEPPLSPEDRAARHREAREKAARSKSGLWGPTHSMDSEDSSVKLHPNHHQDSSGHFSSSILGTPPSSLKTKVPQSQGTESTKSTTSSSASKPADAEAEAEADAAQATGNFPAHLERMWTNAQSALNCRDDKNLLQQWQQEWRPQWQAPSDSSNYQSHILDYVHDVCSPWQPRSLDETLRGASPSSPVKDANKDTTLGISPLEPPGDNQGDAKETEKSSTQSEQQRQTSSQRSVGRSSDNISSSSQETPADRRRQRHRQRQLRAPPSSLLQLQEGVEITTNQVTNKGKSSQSANESSKTATQLPLESLTVKKEEARALERSISELTMRSSYGEATARLAENRRMAYYAVGRHHRNSGRGGNRRCYFTGKLILGGAPFYAGSVQQGLRTLVVFCLPSAIGLPQGSELKRENSYYSTAPSVYSITDRPSARGDGSIAQSLGHSNSCRSVGVNAQPRPDVRRPSLLTRKRSGVSKLSSLDDMDLSIEEDLDPNWGLDRDYLLSVLPEPSQDLLDEMSTRFPAQFETLPVQVRSPHCWSLYVKFCFFSGLPIAEGEMHYRVRDEISDAYGEEIILSHDVMEAVNGESAEILRLPNLKTFRYLRKHYNQQSGKLSDNVFQRQSWELVRPEI